jgi:hypothetical protein
VDFVLPKPTVCLNKTESPPLARVARRPLLPSHPTALSVAHSIRHEMRQLIEELDVRFVFYQSFKSAREDDFIMKSMRSI